MLCRYNIGLVGVAIGDCVLAQHCFKLALVVDPNHSEAFNNLGVRLRRVACRAQDRL